MQLRFWCKPTGDRIIIDELWDDREALAACALSCRAWLYGARIYR